METESEPTTVGLSDSAHVKLKRLKEEGHFADMTDAYRFGIALALAYGVTPGITSGSRQTIFNVGTLDPDKSLFAAVSALRPETNEPVYRTAEKLAEWGVEEISRMAENGEISFSDLFREIGKLSSVISR
jgi:hypothetical protein